MGYVQDAENLLQQGPGTYDLEADTKRQIAEQKKRLLNPSTEELLQGVGTGGGGLITPTQSYNYSSALGGDSASSNANVLDAINQRNNDRSTEYVNTLKRDLNLGAPARDAKRLRQVGSNMGAEAEVQLNNNKILKQYDLDKRRLELYKQQQKDAQLAAILGVIGTVAGTAIGAATGVKAK